MTDANSYGEALRVAHELTTQWLDSMPTRELAPRASADELEFDFALQDEPMDPSAVVRELARLAEPGLMGMPSGRFFGWVIGGTLPAALGADWLVSAWDQNAAMRYATPATAAAEQVAGEWLLELLGLPGGSDVGFTTGATMANFTGITAGRDDVLRQAGWDCNADGLQGAPKITVLAGEERHASVDLALRYAGLGLPTLVTSDREGRIIPSALRDALAGTTGPVLVMLQAGNLHSGSMDPMRESIEIAHEYGAWVHVDGAFGLWAAASPNYRALLDGIELADSWATDAHKTLNVPYDCGVSIVRSPEAVRRSFGTHTSYLINPDEQGPGDPFEKVPEFSRRARGVTVWAALRSLGRDGVTALVDRLAGHARALADGIGALPGAEVLNDVVFTQVSLAFGDDARTQAVTRKLIDEGHIWMSGSHWAGRDILRISVSNWSTDDTDVADAIETVARAMR